MFIGSGFIDTWVYTSKCSDSSFVGNACDISDFSHKLRTKRRANTLHTHNNGIFRQLGGCVIHQGMLWSSFINLSLLKIIAIDKYRFYSLPIQYTVV